MNVVLKSKSGKIVAFWTNADSTIVKHTIKYCFNRYDMIMKHDRDFIKHELDWVAYHLKRFGYTLSIKKKNIKTQLFSDVGEMEIKW